MNIWLQVGCPHCGLENNAQHPKLTCTCDANVPQIMQLTAHSQGLFRPHQGNALARGSRWPNRSEDDAPTENDHFYLRVLSGTALSRIFGL